MADEIKNQEQENKIIKRTASVLVKDEKTDVTGRTCPVYVVRDDVLALNDIVNEKPIDYTKEIHISWLDSALNQFAKEQRYSAWDLIPAPQGAWVSTAYGNKCGIVAGADSQVAITLDNGNTWETVNVIADLSCIAFGSKKNDDDTVTNRFIALSSAGQGIYSDDNGKTWQALTIPNDNYTGIAFIKGKFIAISSTGKIYVSYDMGITFNELTIDVAGFQFTAIATDGEKRVMIVGSSGTNRALYSDDVAIRFKEAYLAQNTWTSVAYGEGKFIAVSTDGDNNIAVFDVVKGGWSYTQAPTQEEWRSISYGARVFTAVATSGKVISSLNGNRWLAVPSHIGEWNTILRTDFFFIALSIADNEQGYNAMRSSNAGLTLIDFATLQEIIEQEPTLKAISPQVLIDYLRYRVPWKLSEGGTERTDGFSQGLAVDVGTAGATLKYTAEETTADEQAEAVLSIKDDGNIYHTAIGKEKGNVAVFDENKYIKTIVDGINIQVIDETSPITSYDEITETGFYGLAKELQNTPLFTEEDDRVGHIILQVTLLEVQGQKIIFQNIFLSGNPSLAYPNYYVRHGQIVDGVARFSIWQKKVINHKEIDFTDFIAEKSKYNIIQLTQETDLNNITKPGKYAFLGDENYLNTIINKPTELDRLAFMLEVDNIPFYETGILKTIKTQIIYDFSNYDFNGINKIKYHRIQLNTEQNTWSNWQKKDVDLSTVASVSQSTTTANNILVKDNTGIIKDITLSDFINNNELFTVNGTFSASNTILMEENGIIKKIPKDEIVGLTNVDLATQTTGVLPVNKGGHGGTNINEARDNLEVLRYKFNESDKNLSNAPTGFATIHLAEDIPSGVNPHCHSLTLYHSGTPVSGTPVNGYAVQYYIGADGFTLYGRVRSALESSYYAWKLLRNIDGSIPAELINLPVGFIYIQLRGQLTPDQLFGTSGKWQDVSSTYAGEFFRAVGGNSASFGSKQNEGLPKFNIVTDRAVHGLGIVLPKGEKLISANKGLGVMASKQGYNGTSAVAIGTKNTSFSKSPFPYFVPNNSIYGASTHVTPYNSAIRIWKKIS